MTALRSRPWRVREAASATYVESLPYPTTSRLERAAREITDF